jgi:hypothetical protein
MREYQETICQITGAQSCELGEVIQSLWSGYGVIQRVQLHSHEFPSAIVKHIDLSKSRENRRGWSGDASHNRKVRSYEVEKAFYESFAPRCNSGESGDVSLSCRVPKLLGVFEKENGAGLLLVLEDLDAAGYDLRKGRVFESDLNACLCWLANFHATFLGCGPSGLWPIGTYWHLTTRQEELGVMDDGPLKQCAADIDARLNTAKFQTLVHGDAKLANFCFGSAVKSGGDSNSSSSNRSTVAAVDFQYVGGGCGMKDVAYLVSSCLDGSESETQQNKLLDVYFEQLKTSVAVHQPDVDFNALESEWRELYSFAWADFCRFLAGWSPGHWKLNEYNDRVTRGVLKELAG